MSEQSTPRMNVESFNLDHTRVVAPFVRVADRKTLPGGDTLIKYDVRFCQPNREHLEMKAVHSIEHLTAELMRNHTDRLIDFSPMGCQTGFYALTLGVEQEDFQLGGDIADRLARLTWPQTVTGCAIAMERTFLPPEFEPLIPVDPIKAIEFVNQHEARADVRVVVGALRDGSRHGLARVLNNPDDLLGAEDLVPGLADALLTTLKEETA